jgi:hypothetical protein
LKRVLKNGQNRSFSRTLAKGQNNNMDLELHADAHDFDMQTKSLEDKKNLQCPDNLQSFSD